MKIEVGTLVALDWFDVNDGKILLADEKRALAIVVGGPYYPKDHEEEPEMAFFQIKPIYGPGIEPGKTSICNISRKNLIPLVQKSERTEDNLSEIILFLIRQIEKLRKALNLPKLSDSPEK